MAEFEELKLTVSLDDKASAGLSRLRGELGQVSTSIAQLSQINKNVDFVKIGRTAEQAGTQIKGLSQQLSTAITHIKFVGPQLRGIQPQLQSLLDVVIPKWARVPVFIVAAVAAVAEAIKALGNYLNDFARSTLEVDSISKEIGVAVGKLRGVQDQMGKVMGRDMAVRVARGFSLRLMEMRKGTDAYYDFIRAAGDTGQNAKELLDRSLQLMDQGKFASAIQLHINDIKNMQKAMRQHPERFSEGDIADFTNARLEAIGLTHESLGAELTEPTQEQLRDEDQRAKLSREFAEEWAHLTQQIREVTDELKTALLPMMRDLAEWMRTHTHWAQDFAEAVVKVAHKVASYYRDLKPLIDWLAVEDTGGPQIPTPEHPIGAIKRAITGSPPSPGPGGGAGAPVFFSGVGGAAMGGESGQIDDNTTELKKLNDTLYAMLNLSRDRFGNVSIGGAAPIGSSGTGADTGTSGSTAPGGTVPSSAAPKSAAPGVPAGTPGFSQDYGPSSGVVGGGGAGFFDPTPFKSQGGAAPMSPSARVGAALAGTTATPSGAPQQRIDSAFEGTTATPQSRINEAFGATKPRYNQPGSPTGSMNLRDLRAAHYGDVLKDPAMREKLYAYSFAEAGGRGPVAVQAFMEETLNRGMARGQSLERVLGSRAYFPPKTHSRARGGVSEATRNAYGPLLENVMGGSNVISYGTGNASGTVGFGGGGSQTFASPGENPERYGIEMGDTGWVSRQLQQDPLTLAQVRRSLDGSMGTEIASRVEGTGAISVKVERFSGSANLDPSVDRFIQPETQRQTQMEPARAGPMSPASPR